MSATRVSPLVEALAAHDAQWAECNGMRVLRQLRDDDSARAAVLGLLDLSYLARAGLKGPAAPDWIQAQGLALPPPNAWEELAGGGVIARLATTEFFVEDAAEGGAIAAVNAALAAPVAGVYPVPRQDAALALTGSRVNELLVQTCNVNFPDVDDQSVVMTLMIGVSVLVIRQTIGKRPCYRVWCDPSYAPYLWNTLAEIAQELGGGPVGIRVLVDA
jgi:sarcosine oxidase subunit gamma